ncbi:MAG TPA: choice-of-anchor D domain-containing protein [Terriglobales bacterium]|nr:choice-of-anchor D domain-containing protein [Terriglobales bacterium]
MVRLGTVARPLILCGLAITTLAFAKTDTSKTMVTYPSAFGVSRNVSELPLDVSIFQNHIAPEPKPGPLRLKVPLGSWQQEDPVLQKEAGPLVSATPGVDFDGIPSPGYVPSDSNLAVGPNHIVETVNVQFAVYDKSGAILAGPTDIQSLFTPIGGDCGNGTYGDPIVLYDRQADRWLITMIGANATISECVAVSKTNDPTGAYSLYGYSFGSNLNDYDKLSVWPTASNSAYLATYNIFQNGQSFIGADLCAFDRTKMLAGNSTAAQLCKMTPSSEFGYLPSDNDGPTPPADGTPGLFISWQNNNPGQLYLRKLTLNFAAGTATLSASTTINVANTNLACGNGGTCVPQLGTTQTLDTLGDRLMYRFAIRHFADHDRAVINHAVANASQVAVRWYELYDPAGTVTLNQQGTFAPDTTYRWMASVAEDQSGNIGLGYSASSSTIHPGIRFTGRVPSDPLGTMESEATFVTGTGSQTPSPNAGNRWGDYTAMVVDPADDCTFWYVDQYEKANGVFNWSTNIGSFAFTSCSSSPDFSLTAAPTAVTITQGSQGTSTITVNPVNGFAGSVTLSATGLPSGVTGTFTPNPATSTSTLTLAATATAATGTNTVTITGTSGSLTHQTTVSLTVNASGGPIVSLTPTALTWGGIVLGTTSSAKSVTVKNTGTATLNISSIATSGDFAQMTSANPCGSSLAAGKDCVIKVTFTPTQVGLRTGNITITDNAPNSPQIVTLSGTGVAQATLTPTTATYSARKVGTTSPVKLFTLTNKQSVALNNIASSTTGDFSISATTCTTSLAAKSTCTISVTFTPTATGTRTGTLSVSDSASNSPQISTLTGTGD